VAHIEPKGIDRYPWPVRWLLRRQARKYGSVLAPALLWGRLPGPFFGMLGLLGAFGRRNPVEARLRSLVSVRVAQLVGCDFCVDLNAHHVHVADGQPDKAAAVRHWRESDRFDDRERAALDHAEKVTQHCDAIRDTDIDALRAHFSDDQIVALTAWIAFQNMSARFNTALGAEQHGFCKLPGAARDRTADKL
jgi:AhpD family alkylhydroperoxidase